MAAETASFGAGCFWGVEATFRKIGGVIETAVGYIGGVTDAPTYEEVCASETGHAEVVQVEFDSSVVTYRELLEVFWNCHDPTTKDRQGPDVGRQYRSVVFFHTPGQKATAAAVKDELSRSVRFAGEIVTEIVPACPFFRAEEYHQRYLEKHGRDSCSI